MTATAEIAMRFREVFLNGAWVANTNYKKELTGFDWKIATAKYSSLNTIALLAQHINYYVEGVLNVFNGGSLDIKDQFSFDFAPIQSQEEWDNFLNRFFSNAEEFATHIDKTTDEELRDFFIDERYGTLQRNIDGMMEHSYYHLGQIVLIKKLLGSRA